MNVQYLAVQNIAFCRNETNEGNFYQLIQLSSKLCSTRHALPNEYLSWKIQNEIIHLMAEDVKRRNLEIIKKNIYFGMSSNEATDVANKSLLSVMHRTVNEKLEASELFSGFYNIPDKKSLTIASELKVSKYVIYLLKKLIVFYIMHAL